MNPTFETALIPSSLIRAVYSKAKEDMEAYMPTYLVWAEAKDKEHDDDRQAEIDARIKTLDDHTEEVKAYEAKIAVWKECNRFCRGPKPSYPLLGYVPMYSRYDFFHAPCHASYARYIFIEIESMLAVAGKSEQIFMTPEQFERMNEFECGLVLQNLQNRAAE